LFSVPVAAPALEGMTMKFKKKPVAVEAIQWDGTLSGVREIEAAFPTLITFSMTSHPPSDKVSSWWIAAGVAGGQKARPEDWIIACTSGEHHVCAPAIFATNYERA